MAGDFKLEKGTSFGDWLHQQVLEAAQFEDDEWWVDRARRVETRLQADRPPAQRLVVEIPWLEVATAFTHGSLYLFSQAAVRALRH